MHPIPRPEPGHFAPHYAPYIDLVPEGDLLSHLAVQARHFEALLGGIDEERALFRYAPGKWSIKELVGHVSDTERIMAYRLLRIARGDRTPLAGFEQDDYVTMARADSRTLEDLASEFSDVRLSTLSLLRSLDPQALTREGVVGTNAVTAATLAHVISGHMAHHGKILEERYLL
jgi:uncharacterized damage-inducible protein DinB